MSLLGTEGTGVSEGEQATDADNTNSDSQGQVSSENSDSLQSEEQSSVKDEVTGSQTTSDQQLDISKIPVDELLKNEDIVRLIQSKTDKGIAQNESRRKDDDRRTAEVKSREIAKKDIEAILATEDSDEKTKKLAEIGQKKVDETLKESKDLEAATRFSTYYEDNLNSNPEFTDKLGTARIKEIADEIQKEGGSVLDYANRLHTAVADKRVDDAVNDTKTSLKEEILAELKSSREAEAQEVQDKVEQRSEDAEEGKSVKKEVEDSTVSKKPVKDLTEEEASTLYGQGELSAIEWEPFRLARLKRRL